MFPKFLKENKFASHNLKGKFYAFSFASLYYARMS